MTSSFRQCLLWVSCVLWVSAMGLAGEVDGRTDEVREQTLKAPMLLILCTGNSCRSHMAEGYLRSRVGDQLKVASAGSHPAGYVHPLAIQVMAEVGVDLAGHRSKSLEEFLDQPVRTVITVCGRADQVCPTFPGQVRRHHFPFDDPAHATGTDEEKLTVFRRVRDEMIQVLDAYIAGWQDGVGQR